MLSPKMQKVANLHCSQVGEGGVGSQLLMLSPEMLKFQIHIFAGVGSGGLAANFLC